jgi:hypothetical protein
MWWMIFYVLKMYLCKSQEEYFIVDSFPVKAYENHTIHYKKRIETSFSQLTSMLSRKSRSHSKRLFTQAISLIE